MSSSGVRDPVDRYGQQLLRERHPYRAMVSSLMRAKLPLVGLVILFLFILTSVAAPLIAPYGPNEVDIVMRLKPPFWSEDAVPGYLLGTDQVGRDILTRLIYGGRVSLAVGFATTALTGIIGVIMGVMAGYRGGALDEVIMRLGDILLAFPFLLLAMVTILMLGPSLRNVILVLGLFGWVGFARMVRGETLSLREKEFVDAARAIGASDFRIVRVHILPNLAASTIVIATFVIAGIVIVEATLSFLGLGVPPAVPSWGMMLSEGRDYMRDAWWLATFPGLLILLLVLSLNLIGDWLRDFLDPRLRF